MIDQFKTVYVGNGVICRLKLSQIKKNVDKSFNLGIKAAAKNAKKIPAIDPNVHKLLVSNNFATDYNNSILKAWLEGFKTKRSMMNDKRIVASHKR